MPDKTLFYVGTYTELIKFGTGQLLQGKGEGIYLVELDFQTGDLKLIEIIKNTLNPSYFAINKKNIFLYAVNELKQFEGKPSGSVSSFKISKTTGELMFVNKQPTAGTDPCHIEINSKGTELFVSNFMSGSICVLPVRPDGSIGELSQFIQHTGSSINPQRQSSPHVHSLIFSPDEQYAFVPDLGLDKLMIYKTNSGSSPLTESEIPYFQTEPGAGPRHGAFNPSGEYFYLINELNCTILTKRVVVFRIYRVFHLCQKGWMLLVILALIFISLLMGDFFMAQIEAIIVSSYMELMSNPVYLNI
jgi:6-phosphogluconolactonase